jgi:hypothetical protein
MIPDEAPPLPLILTERPAAAHQRAPAESDKNLPLREPEI